MKLFRQFFILSCFMFFTLTSARANERDLTAYPCTVFAPHVCFRLPSATEVLYSVPADVHSFEIRRGERLLATAFVNESRETSLGSYLMKIKVSGWDVAGKINESDGARVIVMLPSRQREPVVEVRIEPSEGLDPDVSGFLSSFRPCSPIKSGGQKCPMDPAFGRSIRDVARDLFSQK
ncbi:hypothetical protein MQC88_11085 [Luteimonas sp. 50]|uniref:Uncharacterized protein n=1 Tax=Cognatiluteimonas sedimenti TaxID=2927791 RepID=A0ABT0A678_9GAMM|nr:hypothetical protein [Lysobacter sedimenti]MCJ0826487.1 hypothetical protein [Lysobacter sedimenti]